MKTSTLGLVTLVLLGTTICQTTTSEADDIYAKLKDTRVEPPAVSSDTAKLELSRYPAISNVNQILYFASSEHVQAAQKYLDARAQEILYNAYLKYGATDIPDSDIQGVNLNLGFEEFERAYAFRSLRQKLEKEIQAYSSSVDEPNPALDPERNAVPENSLRTLLNVYSEINVGKIFYRMSPQGSQQYSTEAALIASRTTIATSPASAAARLLQATQCQDPVYGSKFVVHSSGKYRIYIVLRHYCFLCFGILKNYRVEAYVRISRKVFGIWWPSFRPVYASAYGAVSGLYFSASPREILRDLCLSRFPYNQPTQTWSTGVWITSHVIKVNYRTRIGWTNGNFYGATPLSPTLITAWPFNV